MAIIIKLNYCKWKNDHSFLKKNKCGTNQPPYRQLLYLRHRYCVSLIDVLCTARHYISQYLRRYLLENPGIRAQQINWRSLRTSTYGLLACLWGTGHHLSPIMGLQSHRQVHVRLWGVVGIHVWHPARSTVPGLSYICRHWPSPEPNLWLSGSPSAARPA